MGRGTSYNGLYGEAPPERGTFFRHQVYERVRFLLVEVYERVGESAFGSVKGPRVYSFIKPGKRSVFLLFPI